MNYRLDKNKLDKLQLGDKLLSVNLEKLYITEYDINRYLVINSFKDECLILQKDIIDDNKIPAEICGLLSTPNKMNKDSWNSFKNDLENDAYVEKGKKVINIIIALTYACNLKCSYCYQQYNPKLKKETISVENLYKIFDVIREYKTTHPDKTVEIGLFGGEPLLKANEEIIDMILKFCKTELIKLNIVTNGVNLDYFLKKIIINRNVIRSIATTIDSSVANETTRKYIDDRKNEKNSASYILDCLNVLLSYNVPVSISSNIDELNICDLPKMHKLLQDNGFIDNEKFSWYIGRVDDRMYETKYPFIISDTDILLELDKLEKFENNCHAAFIKTVKNLVDKLDMGFNQQERKGKYNYCWTSSPLTDVFYIDNDLDVFRCTYTVGRKEFAMYNLNEQSINDYNPINRTYLNYEKCQSCNIGGYCSGGCQLSFKMDSDKQCEFEINAFNDFLHKILMPKLRSRENDVV